MSYYQPPSKKKGGSWLKYAVFGPFAAIPDIVEAVKESGDQERLQREQAVQAEAAAQARSAQASRDQYVAAARKAAAPRQPGVTVLGRRTDGTGYVTVPDVDRQSGMYIVGVQGTGKSSLLESIIDQLLVKPTAKILLDPHGDLIERTIPLLAQHCLAKTYLLNLEDTDFPFGLNLFSLPENATTTEQQQALDRILDVFAKCFPDTSRMLLEKYLGNIAPVFFANAPMGYAMSDIPKFLMDELFRSRLLQSPRLNYFIRSFWTDEYAAMSPSTRRSETASLATRLNRFLRSPIAGSIIGQSQTTINFRAAIENREILLIRLPVKTLKEDAELIGRMLVSEITAAIFSFADTPPDKRPGVDLIVDEFEHFATSDFAELFVEGRKFFGSQGQGGLVIAHQFRSQLPEYLQDATLTARTIVVLQATIEDAGRLARLFPPQSTPVPVTNLPLDSIKWLTSHSSSHPLVARFVTDYLLKLESFSQGKSRSQPFLLGNVMCSVQSIHAGKQELNNILYRCQRERRSDLYIPPLALMMLGGAANFGIAYAFETTKSWGSDDTDWQFTDNARLLGHPAFLQDRAAVQAFINQHAEQKYWYSFTAATTYHPGFDCVQMLTLLRAVLDILARAPLGEAVSQTTMETAQLLSSLPRRHALVKIGEQVAAMRTLDTPQAVSAEELAQRKQMIIAQTRQKYCRPVQAVEQEMLARLGEGVIAGTVQPGQPPEHQHRLPPPPRLSQPRPEPHRPNLFDEE